MTVRGGIAVGRGALRLWPLWILGAMQVAAWWGGPRAGRLGLDAAWPDLAHPLGIDGLGRDYLWIVALGAERFVLPAAVAAVALVALGVAFAAVARGASSRTLQAVRSAAGWVGSIPRMLVVVLAMMALDEPSAWVMAAWLLVLYLPLLLDETSVRLDALGRERILLGAVAHGLPARVIVWRHLALGHLRPMLLGHAAYLFAQVALMEIAISYVFGSSAVMSGLGASWGTELRRLMARIPHPGSDPCWGQPSPCAAQVEALQAAALVLLVALLIGGTVRLGRAWRRDGMDRA